MKTKRKLKKYLKILKKDRVDICHEMRLDYRMIKHKLIDSYECEMRFRKIVKKVKIRKRFRKALAKYLGVKYSEIKHLLPTSLNSTLIANYLNSYIEHFSHEEIRNICQQLKLEFEDFP